jgi:hypothetical protein
VIVLGQAFEGCVRHHYVDGDVDPGVVQRQQFFVTVILSGRLLRSANRARGTFRPYLNQSTRNFLIDEHRRLARRSNGEVSESSLRLDEI